MNNQKQTKDSL